MAKSLKEGEKEDEGGYGNIFYAPLHRHLRSPTRNVIKSSLPGMGIILGQTSLSKTNLNSL